MFGANLELSVSIRDKLTKYATTHDAYDEKIAPNVSIRAFLGTLEAALSTEKPANLMDDLIEMKLRNTTVARLLRVLNKQHHMLIALEKLAIRKITGM